MKKFLFMFLLAAAVAGAFTFALAEETQAEEKKFVIHGEIRQRADFIDNFSDFNSDFSDSALFFPYRARIAAEGHFSKDVIGYAEFQSFGVWGDAPPDKGGINSTLGGLIGPFNPNVDQNTSNSILYNANSTQLYQAWIGLNNIAGSKFSLKVGRQELVKGSEMLLGDLDFYSGIAHDGMVGSFNYDSFGLDLWWSRPLQSGNFISTLVPPSFFTYPTTGVPDHQSVNFYGAWADFKKIPKNIGLSAYLMNYEVGQSSGTPFGYAFYTLGARANKDAEAGKNGFAWNAELAMQSGDFSQGTTLVDKGDISTMGFEGMFGYNLHSGNNDHLFRFQYVMASGDKDPADPDKVESFNPLFQDYHQRYGLSDIFSFSNLTAMSLGWNMRMKDHCFGVDLWDYQLSEDMIDPYGDKQNALGSEVDAYWKLQYNPNTQIMAGLAYFMPGDVIKTSNYDPVAPYDYNNKADAGMRLVGNLRLRF